MSPSASFVIPALNEESLIADLLLYLRKSYPDCELIVVDGGSEDDTVVRALPLCDELLVGKRGRALQMNLGAQVARSDYLFFLHADSRPTVVAADLRACMARQPRWGFSRVRLSGKGWLLRVIEWFMNRRSALTGVATGDQMLFLHRELFEQSGGFDAIPLMEDVAYCKRLRRICRPLLLPGVVLASSRRWEQQGVVRTMCRMWLLRLGYFLGVSPRVLWRHYYGR